MRLLNNWVRKPLRKGCWSATLVLLLVAGLETSCQFTGMTGILHAQNSGNSGSNTGGGGTGTGNSNNDGRSNSEFMSWGYRSVVGGFAIDAGQAFRAAPKSELASYSETLRTRLQTIPNGLDRSTPVRKVSLRRLGELLKACADEKKPIPESAQFLGGMTSIEHVIAVPDDNDIYLVGPAEAWTVDAQGNVVGKDTGKPVLLLEDLLTVLRAWDTQTPELISCSIDPTRQALQNFANMARIVDPEQKIAANRKAMGMMDVSFSGIPAESRMACVLAAADYRMKRLSLGFDNSPVHGLRSYTSMIRKTGTQTFAPRFWMEPKYGTLEHDGDGLVWKVANTRVETLTEREYFDKSGNRNATGRKDAIARRWAQAMTKSFAELAKAEPVFAEAKNCMDVALVVALIYFRNLPEKSGCPLNLLKSSAMTPRYATPSKVDSDSLVRVFNREGDFVSVTGGVIINPWTVVRDNVVVNSELAKSKGPVAFAEKSWWAN